MRGALAPLPDPPELEARRRAGRPAGAAPAARGRRNGEAALRGSQARVRVTRGPETESVHDVHGVVVGVGRWEEIQFGEPERLAYWRSSMKPFQALPLVEEGTLEAYGFGEPELALCCASHHGTPEHLARARAMLDRLGLAAEELTCGPHLPFDQNAARELLRSGGEPGRLHNNCSGKHAGMLALALHQGWETRGYAEFGHPVQRRIRRGLARWLDVDPEAVSWASDGCGVPTPFLSLRQMARAYARLGRAVSEARGPSAVVAAMTSWPNLVGGSEALSTRLMQATDGRLVAKEGAEGVFCVAAPGAGWGAAVKVADGTKRALAPALVGMLATAGLLEAGEEAALAELRHPPVTNWAGDEVGRLVAEVEPHRATVAGRI